MSENSVRINLSRCEYEVVEEIAESLSWKAVYSTEDTESDVIWQDVPLTSEELSYLRPFQRANHYPGLYSISRKDHLASKFKLMRKVFPEEYNFFPPSWVLPKDIADLKAQFNAKRAKTFIVKPEASSQGRGIFLTRCFEEIPQQCVVQRYMHRPFLLDGYKFDLRVYVLVTCCEPLRVYIHKEGLVRLATEQYSSPLASNLDNLYMHLTNYAINKNNPEFHVSEDFDGHKRSLKEFFKWLEDNGHDDKRLWDEICDLAVKTICLAQPSITHLYRSSQPGDPLCQICFQIIGLDIFLDHKLKPFVLEVNQTPSFATESELDHKVKLAVISDAFKMLGLTKNNRSKYYSYCQSMAINRAIKRVKEMKEIEEQSKKQIMRKRIRNELRFAGGYQLIYPAHDSEQYETYIRAAKQLSVGYKSLSPVKKRNVSNCISAKRKVINDAKPRFLMPRKRSLSPVIYKCSSVKRTEQRLPEIKLQGNFLMPKVFIFDEIKHDVDG